MVKKEKQIFGDHINLYQLIVLGNYNTQCDATSDLLFHVKCTVIITI